MLTSKLQDRLHVYRVAIQMDRENSTCAGSQDVVELLAVHSIRVWIDVDEDRSGPYQSDCLNSCMLSRTSSKLAVISCLIVWYCARRSTRGTCKVICSLKTVYIYKL